MKDDKKELIFNRDISITESLKFGRHYDMYYCLYKLKIILHKILNRRNIKIDVFIKKNYLKVKMDTKTFTSGGKEHDVSSCRHVALQIKLQRTKIISW